MPRASQQIEIKTPEQIALMREAGLVVARALAAMRAAVAPGVSTAALDAVAHDVIRSAGAVPSFLGYHGYPATICSSVNEQIVHAIPSTRQVLRDGDLISLDCGAILDGWHGDAAISVVVGEAPRPELAKLVTGAEEALWAGIVTAARAMRAGGGRLGDISAAIERASRQNKRYGIVRGYGGHGIGTEMHMEPFVLNYGKPGRGPHLVPGMCLAIEPMLTLGSPRTVELADGWTVVTADGSVAAHVEHTVALFDDGVWVLTADDGGASRLGDLLAGAARSTARP
ncbi:type I methionyl aminopeptidase [Virgisporangium ochraceum]|uniref:Methionine aminopeptidase n=1 Tax=Virgisporangium ochraceum TaxID=65505 RepID=A0A8J3ZJE7_9ACTN|nr:type I methionyl aminopeptidase [Virgisporangium ochraceum]GIJ65344.1 methionine aminopeptidase [Virgisporangium ochraceum]